MIMKADNSRKTDLAWNKLYSRLEAESLIDKDMYKPKAITLSPTLKWVVAAAVLVIGLTTYSLFSSRDHIRINKLECNEELSTMVASLEDGSIVGLSNHSSIEYPSSFSTDKREVRLEGNAYFYVAKDKKTFLIETNMATVEVLGTAFSIESNSKNFYISVQRGKVKVSPKNERAPIYVEADENLLIEPNKSIKTKSKNHKEFSNYFERIHFKDQNLGDIARIINLNSDSLIIKVDPKVTDRILTLSLANNDKEQIADMIAMVLDLKTKKENNIITILESK